MQLRKISYSVRNRTLKHVLQSLAPLPLMSYPQELLVVFIFYSLHLQIAQQYRAVHKRRLQSGLRREVLEHFADKGREWFLQMRTSALLVQKNLQFFEICGVSTRTRGRLSHADNWK